ncbi:MAG: phenylalanine--tRNA ligase subunit beta [Rhodocyclaceae bacterium]
MQFSESWLRAFINPPLSSAELAHLLTMAGLEVEALDPVAPPFSGVVVAEVVQVEKHPNADKLKLCRVQAGEGGPLTIVCGAPNVAAGLKVPCALVGAALPGLTIRAAKVRGIESFGMLCSARELGLSEDHGGLLVLPADAPVGADIRTYLDLDDKRFTLKLTPNRSDCLGIVGVAREVAALTGAPLNLPAPYAAPVTAALQLPVSIAASDLCGRFSGRVVTGVNPTAPTPDWMRQRLERAGQRCISALVDISNYVMLELNRPNHVFDLDKVKGGLEVRWARKGEQLLLLNGATIELDADVGVIASGGAVESLAGIMGGEATAVGDHTTSVYVEAAFWWPQAIQGRARRYGFTSEAGHRFERGVDFADTVAGVERVTQLILEICGGAAGPIDDQLLNLPQRSPIRLRPDRARRVLGIALDAAQIEILLRGLGFAFERINDAFLVTPPSHRFDLAIEEDLIEELARVHGYDNIPAAVPVAPLSMLAESEGARPEMRLKRLLAARDYQEVVNFSFVDAQWEADFCANASVLALANPIASQMGVMRSSLIGGLVANVVTNRSRRVDRVRVFEAGRCFLRGDERDLVPGFRQPLRLAVLAAGSVVPEQWGAPARAVDFFDVKGDIEALLAPRVARFEPVEHPALHPGRTAAVWLHDRQIGILGEIHPQWVQKYELGPAPIVCELELDALLATAVPAYRESSKFPGVVRDIALVVSHQVSASSLIGCLRKHAPGIITDVRLFDVFVGKGLDQEEKSLAFRIVMQDTEKTLADAEVDAAVAALVRAAAAEYGARLRG